tara:strand:+ start:1659 stop:1811 length:153 start_codon:yes stop_codon:yes gene_type:complete
MENLEVLKVRELNICESREVEGGVAPLVVYGAYLVAGIVTGLIVGYYMKK